MEQLKVRKKDIIVSNTVVYLILAFFFLYLQHAYRYHLSPFSLVYLRKSAELFWYVAVPVVFSILLIWRHHRWSKMAFAFSVSLVGLKVIEGLFIEFNKIIVVALFFFTVISYFLYQLLSHYLSLASINPNYSKDDLWKPLLREITCKVEHEGKIIEGFLTNWDSEGCFVKLPSRFTFKKRVKVYIHFQDRDFEQSGEVVSHSVDLKGIGIKFNETPKDLKVFNWSEFMELVQELGFQPERLR